MDFVSAIKSVFSNYANFTGRAPRSEYWFFVLFYVVLSFVLGLVDGSGILAVLLMLATVLPSLAVSIRRLHDTDRSGWWLLLSFIPLVGAIILIIFFVQPGTAGPNRYGDDPFTPPTMP